MFRKICDLRNFAKLRVSNCAYSLELLYQRLATLLKELPAQVFCCNLCIYFKNTILYSRLPGDCFRNTKINNFYCDGRAVTLRNSLFETTIYFYRTLFSQNMQKQPPEVVYKKRCSQKIRKIHRKTTMPEPFSFSTLQTRLCHRCCKFCEIFKRNFFENTTGRLLLNMCNGHL